MRALRFRQAGDQGHRLCGDSEEATVAERGRQREVLAPAALDAVGVIEVDVAAGEGGEDLGLSIHAPSDR